MTMRVSWTPEVKKRLWALIDNINTEVGGFGYAALEEGGTELIWYDVFLVPQRAGMAEVDYNAEGLQYAIDRAARDDVLSKPDHVWVSWHSHNSMKAFWSGVDEDCINIYGAGGMPIMLSFVGNHDHEYKARLDFFGVQHRGVTIPRVTMSDLTVELEGQEPVDPFTKAIREELVEYVKRPSYVTHWTRGGQARETGGKSNTATTAATQGVDASLGKQLSLGEQLGLGRGDPGDADDGEGDFENVGGLILPRGALWDDPDELTEAEVRELEGGRWV